MDLIWNDTRQALRLLARRPLFSLVVVVTLALGIGATTSVFSLVDGILWKPLPFEEPDRLVTLWQTKGRGEAELGQVAPGNLLSWQRESSSFDATASAEPYGFDLTEGTEPERVAGWLVSPGFFRLLGVEALHGRTFSLEEERRAEGDGVVLLSHQLWKSRFGSDPQVVGDDLRLGDEPYRITGVLPAEFDFPPGRDLWVARAFSSEESENRTETNLTVVGRLAEGVTRQQAEADLAAVAVRLAEAHPTTNRGIGVGVVPIRAHILGSVRGGLLYILWAVAFVHLIVCANVGNLLLVQGIQRRSELACRSAMGAGRWQLIRQLALESLILSCAGALPGLLLAFLGTRVATRLAVVGVPRLAEVSLDSRALGFALLLALLTALVFGLVPSIRLSRPDLVRDLGLGRGAGNDPRGGFLGKGLLVTFEVALAVMLLMATGLLIRSFERLISLDPGFETEDIVVLETHVWDRFPAPHESEAFFRQTAERLSALPSVEAAGAVSALPLSSGRNVREIPFFVEGREPPTPDQQPTALHTMVAHDYFRALEIPLVGGRLFEDTDAPRSRAVALVNESLVERYWPDGDPVGARILVHFLGRPVLREIVGIVGDTRQASLSEPARPEIYIPHAQSPFGSMTFVVRGRSSSARFLETVKQEIRAAAPGLPFSRATTMEELVSTQLEPRRLSLRMLLLFSGIGLFLAALGVYGLLSTSAQARRHEIGMRMALGGSPPDIFAMLLREGAKWILAGVLLGGLAALALFRLLQGFLYDISYYDPVTFVGVALVMACIGLLAIVVPARRAMKLTPLAVLRHE